MKVFALGGGGRVGCEVVGLLARSDVVSEIAVAGRSLERAEEVAASIGGKGTAVRVDAGDAREVARRLADYDLVVNCAPDDTVLATLGAAIEAGSHYCDPNSVIEDALELGSKAEAAGITAVVASGIGPSLSNLMGVHAARQLDEVKQLQRGMTELISFDPLKELTPREWVEDPDGSRAGLHEFGGFMTWLLQMMRDNGTRMMLDYERGEWVEVHPVRRGVDVPHDGDGTIRSYPYVSFDSFWRGLPTDLSELSPMEMWFSTLPPQLDAVLRDQALRVLDGDIDPETAVRAFFDLIDHQPHPCPTAPADYTPIPIMWVRAVGYEQGRPAASDCWLSAPLPKMAGWFLTSAALAAAALQILQGDVPDRGVMTAEKAFDPVTFFDEIAGLLPEPPHDGKLVGESLHWLE